MMQKVGTLYIGDVNSCQEWVGPTVHACKHPCFVEAVGGQPTPDQPFYLFLNYRNHLYLNLIDPSAPLFKVESFREALRFLDEHPVSLVHCNRGQSRAPSIALLWLAKRKVIPSNTYDEARRAFGELYPYNPGKGIATFLGENWEVLDYERSN